MNNFHSLNQISPASVLQHILIPTTKPFLYWSSYLERPLFFQLLSNKLSFMAFGPIWVPLPSSPKKFSLTGPGHWALPPLNSHRRPHPPHTDFYCSLHLSLLASVSITMWNAEKNTGIRTRPDLNLNPDSTTHYLHRTWGKQFTFLSLGSLKS